MNDRTLLGDISGVRDGYVFCQPSVVEQAKAETCNRERPADFLAIARRVFGLAVPSCPDCGTPAAEIAAPAGTDPQTSAAALAPAVREAAAAPALAQPASAQPAPAVQPMPVEPVAALPAADAAPVAPALAPAAALLQPVQPDPAAPVAAAVPALAPPAAEIAAAPVLAQPAEPAATYAFSAPMENVDGDKMGLKVRLVIPAGGSFGGIKFSVFRDGGQTWLVSADAMEIKRLDDGQMEVSLSFDDKLRKDVRNFQYRIDGEVTLLP